MKYKTLAVVFAMASISFAQVKDISFTISPFAQYSWTDKQSGLEENATFLGGTIGFGFGEYLELRGLYMQSIDLKTDFSKFGLANYDPALFTPQEVDVTRWGGELKANIGTGKLNPFVTFGTGVQNIAIKNGADFDQIYTSFGLGIKAKILDRIIFTLEGNTTLYNDNAGKNYLTDADKTTFGVTNSDFESSLLNNWGARASLQFYLGGRRPGTMSALDKAYMNQFKSGFKGLRLIVEPSMSYIEFDNDSQFRNTWLLGGYAGIDFNEYTGIRAFYFQATKDDQISTNFDDLSMYGLEFRARLNDGNGVTPYLILGGGYLKTNNNYLGKNSMTLEGEEFASAGLGLNIPLAKYLLITGGVKGMITSGSDVEDLTSPETLQTHIMYNAGLKFVFGKKSKNPNDIYKSNVQNELDEQDRVAQEAYTKKLSLQKEKNQAKINQLKVDYQNRLDSLQIELQKAYEQDDIEKAVIILENKKEINKELEEVKKIQSKVDAQPVTVNNEVRRIEELKEEQVVEKQKAVNDKTVSKMSPEELNTLIVKKIEEINQKNSDSLKRTELEARIKQLEEQIELEKNKIPVQQSAPLKSTQKKDNVAIMQENETLRNEIESLKKYNELNSKKIELLQNKDNSSVIKENEILRNEVESLKKNNGINTEKIELNSAFIQENATLRNEVESLQRKVAEDRKNITVEKNSTTTERDNTNVIPVVSLSDQKEKDSTILANIIAERDSIVYSEGRFIPEEKTVVNTNKMVYKGASSYLGINFGNQTTLNIGVRANFGIQRTKLEFMPELYYGIGGPSSFGLTGNVIYPFEKISSEEFLIPYAGFGVGVIRNDGDVKLTQNIILGTNLKFLEGRLFVDYTIRNFFKYNQFSVGYRYKF